MQHQSPHDRHDDRWDRPRHEGERAGEPAQLEIEVEQQREGEREEELQRGHRGVQTRPMRKESQNRS